MTDHTTRIRCAELLLAAISLTLTGCAVLQPARPPHATTPHPAPAHPAHEASPPPLTAGQAAGLLPFTPAQLADAATLAGRFAAAYSTWSWRQPPAAWLATLTPITAGQLNGPLAQAAATPGLLAQRTQDHQAASATTSGAQIRDLTPGSVTLTLTVRQAITSTSGTTTAASSLAITLTPSGGGWQVYDVEPAAAGNTGGQCGPCAMLLGTVARPPSSWPP
jgi:hypothetical protein